MTSGTLHRTRPHCFQPFRKIKLSGFHWPGAMFPHRGVLVVGFLVACGSACHAQLLLGAGRAGCPKPKALSAAATSDTAVSLTWQAGDGGSPATCGGYLIAIFKDGQPAGSGKSFASSVSGRSRAGPGHGAGLGPPSRPVHNTVAMPHLHPPTPPAGPCRHHQRALPGRHLHRASAGAEPPGPRRQRARPADRRRHLRALPCGLLGRRRRLGQRCRRRVGVRGGPGLPRVRRRVCRPVHSHHLRRNGGCGYSCKKCAFLSASQPGIVITRGALLACLAA